MTLDEWKAQQKRVKQAFNIRRPGEGCDDSQWKKTYVLKKKTPEEEEEESDEEDEVSLMVCAWLFKMALAQSIKNYAYHKSLIFISLCIITPISCYYIWIAYHSVYFINVTDHLECSI